MWAWLRLAGGAAILALLVLKLGADPFVEGLQRTSPQAVVAATAVTLVTTVCCSWRWSRVVGRLGVDLSLRSAVGAYYRSQFVNATLPGGVLGDVERAVRHGRDAGSLGTGVRGVAWERVIGLAVYVVGAVGVALLAPALRPFALGLAAVVALAALVLLVLRPLLGVPAGRSHLLRWLLADARLILGPGGPRCVLLLTSLVTAAGHTAIFVLAARSVGVQTPLTQLVPVAMVVLVGSTIPTNVAGWGPREATAAGAFATLGLSADQGVTVAVVYGVLALLATLPGALLLLARRAPSQASARAVVGVETVTVGGAAHG
jgi:uncharacterized membrane protein YbhN (UPF0104 family)